MAHVIKQTKTLPSVVLIQEKLATSVLLFGRNNFITWATVSYFLKSHFWPVEYSPFQKFGTILIEFGMDFIKGKNSN